MEQLLSRNDAPTDRLEKIEHLSVNQRVAVIDAVETGPKDRAQAHRTRFTARVDSTPLQARCAQFGARLADRDDFRMSRRIIGGGDLVGAFPDDLTIVHNDGPERSPSSAVNEIPFGKGNGGTHECVVIHGLIHCNVRAVERTSRSVSVRARAACPDPTLKIKNAFVFYEGAGN